MRVHELSRRVRLRDSIYVKSVVLTTLLITLVVVFPTVYFPSSEIETLQNDNLARVSMYGEVLSRQLRSAIAFSDHETAREVVGALDSDADVVFVAVFDEDGLPLALKGDPSPWVARARQGVVTRKLFSLNGRIAVVAPVASLEGPRGTLVIEISIRRALGRQQTIKWTALAIAVAMILAGVLISSLLARRFARRLREIGTVACSVAAGTPGTDAVQIEAWDEIGVVASAFNVMVAQLQDEKSRLQASEEDLARSNRELETRVEQRTSQLRAANGQLVEEMECRSKVELELRQAQKLESVGRLAAGVAHEINTPIQFVNDSVHFVRESATALLELVAAQQRLIDAHHAQTNVEEAVAHMETALENADLDFLRDELPLALDRTHDGIQRVAVIVQSMKVFSHHSTGMSATDLNRAVASTLVIARNEYKYIADLVSDYGDLPLVVCAGGEINQVILNLVLNAAHAIEDVVRGTSGRGRITVRTWREGEWACVAVADTGGGIPDEVRDHIYDPFFTTKDVGRGTGQGLAIARSVVVDRHGGTIAFQTVIGKGTEFVLRIPIGAQSQLREAA